MQIALLIGLIGWLWAAPLRAEAPIALPTPSAGTAATMDASAFPTGPDAVDAPVRAIEIAAASPLRARLLRAWTVPAPSLEARVERTVRAGYQLGMRDLEAPARAILLAPAMGDALERAEAAVRLAPALPAAHAALARARWEAGDLGGAVAAASAALRKIPHHLEASLWARAQGFQLLANAVAGGALLFLALVAALAIPRFVRDLGIIREDLPTSSRFALLASLVLLPTVLGEGPAGLVLALGFVAIVYGTMWRRAVVVAVALAYVAAVYPLTDASARARAAMGADPVALAAHAAEHGFPSADELARVQHAEGESFAASRALALRAKRMGRLREAHARYAALLETAGADASPDLLNNAAGVELDLGNVDEAIRLYERASKRAASPEVLFNLSQAYGKAIRLDEQGLALAEAQTIDPQEIARLTGEFGATALGLVADIAIPADVTEASMDRPEEGRLLARVERGRRAPGWLGRGVVPAASAFGVALALGLGFGLFLTRRAGEGGDRYSELARILQDRGGDSSSRMEKLAEIRARQARFDRAREIFAWLVPGAAGVVRGHPLLGWIGASLFALAMSLLWMDLSRIPDPLALGTLSGTVRVIGAALSLGAYAVILTASLALQERS